MLDINADNEKLNCGMKGLHQSAEQSDLQLGVITKEDLPKSYKLVNHFLLYFGFKLNT